MNIPANLRKNPICEPGGGSRNKPSRFQLVDNGSVLGTYPMNYSIERAYGLYLKEKERLDELKKEMDIEFRELIG